MSEFTHLDGLRGLFVELHEVNDRILTGDIVSAKAALKTREMKRILTHYAEALSEDGATAVFLDPFVAAGGWVGITYSYDLGGVVVSGSATPRRI